MSPRFQSFQVKKYLKYKPKKYFDANPRNCLKEPFLIQLLVGNKLESNLCNQMTRNNSIHSRYLFVISCIVAVQTQLCGALTFS